MAMIVREELSESIGREVARLRVKHGWSQKELHCESGVSLQRIVLIEAGYAPAHSSTLMRLLKAMGEEELSI